MLYSVPPFRLKAVAGADWLINMWGFGTLTPYAGWATTGLPLDAARGTVLLAFCPLFAALYPLTQLYQIEEDTRRGDRTLALALGPRRSLDLAIAAVLLAFGLFFAAAPKTAADPGPPGRGAHRLARRASPLAQLVELEDPAGSSAWHVSGARSVGGDGPGGPPGLGLSRPLILRRTNPFRRRH